MVCSPSDNNLNPGPSIPVPPIPGFGFPFMPPAIPYPDIKLPDGIPEDLLNLLSKILANIPGGIMLPFVNTASKKILDLIASLLNQLSPYLSLYNFFQALLNMIMCIMDVLCALMNPFAIFRALNRLFKRCLPDFLNLFPWLALIAMIIALLLLLLALIDYLISQIIAIIRDIIENLLLLAKVISFKGTESDIIAAARKIAMLLCIIEQLFAILVAFKAIMAIIQALAAIAGRSVCGSGDTETGDDPGCCDQNSCPDFISQNPDGLTGTVGELIYYSQANNVLIGLLADLVVPPLRNESWQFVDLKTQQFNIKDIITPSADGSIYWPDGNTFAADSSVKRAPYLLDMTMSISPRAFNSSDTGGLREFVIKDAIAVQKPYIGATTFNGSIDYNKQSGTILIQGGLVYEADGTTPYLINGVQATLNTFIHKPAIQGAPASEDGYFIHNIKYTLKPNHAALAITYGLITAGCIPAIASERAIVNIVAQTAVPQLASVISRIGPLPDIDAAITCMTTALAKLRTDVSPVNTAIFQAEVEVCLGTLRKQTIDSYTACVTGGVSPFKTTVSLNANLQFTSLPIKVSVTLRDPSGTVITQNMPIESQAEIAKLITSDVTFGNVSTFVYDGYQDFVADLTSTAPGSGELTASFEGNVISIVTGQNNDATPTAITNDTKTYTFVGAGAGAGAGAGSADPVPRRNESDIGGGD